MSLILTLFDDVFLSSTGNECSERLAFYGIDKNLVSYFTKVLHEGNASAAKIVNTWSGTCYVTPLLGAVVADSYWGRYWTILVFSTIYFLGMIIMTVSASVSAFRPPSCTGSSCQRATAVQFGVLFLGLYLVALGSGGIKCCVSSFGADQFDDTDSTEKKKKTSFFNWFYFTINVGSLIASSFLVWVQDNVGWEWGFGIPTVFMGLSIISFIVGTPLYRLQKPGGSPLTRLCQVLVASLRKWKEGKSSEGVLLFEVEDKYSIIQGSRKIEHTDDFKCLDRAAIITSQDAENQGFVNPWRLCTVTQVEELKILVRLFPIWATSIVFSAVFAQMSTTFVEQGMVMNTNLGRFKIPPASLSIFDIFSVMMLIPVYDALVVPIASRYTGLEIGFTELQRMGMGLVLSIVAMAAAALVEMKRLDLARQMGDITKPAPMSIFWQIPQYMLFGIAEVFFYVGKMEFFYDQSPDAMRTLCTALSLVTSALGNYLSTLILTVVTFVTTRGGQKGWIPNNLNEGHLDYYFWVLVALSFFNFMIYMVCAFKYKEKIVN
eukprot:TRINITY_DN1822_c0_g1_i4.p1 TRINITY_DN1822_c0_g1~~TRINITY_DN1822_c0_g1_i4.p1  ORF type:complete len:562 (-),score=46.48 TRINITY_DN1822_c0_g1_i4:514-2154(-)